MDPMDNNSITSDNALEGQQSQLEGAGVGSTVSPVKKSWGFRRTTIARREFMDEVGDLTHSPPPARRGRNRRTNQTPQPAPETQAPERTTQATRSVLDELEWSAPSSPVADESKPGSEASAGGSLDPSLWQDFGSAFHTAFSLLGGGEGLSLSDALAVPDILEATDAMEAPPPEVIEDTENIESADEMEISQPVTPENVAGGEVDDVVLISSQDEDSDDMTLIQIKEQLASQVKQGDTRARGGKGGKGKARGKGRGRGRGRGRGKGRGRGRGRAVVLQPSIADHEDNDEDVVLVNPSEQQLQQLQDGEKENDSPSPADVELSSANSDSTPSPAQQSNSDCIIIDTDLDQITAVAPGQYDDAPEEEEEVEEEKKDDKTVEDSLAISDTEGSDSNALYCICRQKQDKRFMICCDSCQEWFHGDCVGISQMQGRKMERKGEEYICPPCMSKRQSQLQPEPQPQPQPEPELSFPECLTLSPPGEEERQEEQQDVKETVVVIEEKEEEEVAPVAPVVKFEPEPEAEMETDSSFPLCIGPGCAKQALQDSVYCGTDCILQHAAFTMKTLSGPKVPKPRGRSSKKAATARPTAKGQRSGRMSKRLAGKAEEEGEEEEVKEEDGGQEEAASASACDPSLTEVQAPTIPSSKFNTPSIEDSKQEEAETEAVTPSSQPPEDTLTDAAPSSQPVTEPAPPQSHSQEKAKEPINSGVSKQQSAESSSSVPPNPPKSSLSPAAQSPSTSAPRHHETGALMVTKTTYVIPKKQPGPQPPSSHVSASASGQKSSSAPTLLNETRNLLVPPAPSAPSSRPSQPNNQVRQSIQRSLTSILFKRVCDCEDLDMSESEVAKLVASIEMEMFDIFRNTDSKYMNKYRTIMFNLKDPRNKGLLYQVVRGEIKPFRLARMSQKDMQAIKASEPSPKETTEGKDAAPKVTSLLQKPEAVKVDLPSLIPQRPSRSTVAPQEQKKSLPAPALKTRSSQPNQPSQPSQGNALPDILACMLKDTTSEHKAHLFDLKCKICTGQILPGEEEEPMKKKPRVCETKEKHEPFWKKSAGDDSPLRAPPDSPDMDSPTSSLMDPTSRLIIDAPPLTIVESPASPVMDSPASPMLESPASPVMESPASPAQDSSKSTTRNRAYTPVVIPAVSTVTITRRDPRTAASRFSAPSSGTSGPSNATPNQVVPYAPLKDTISTLPSAPAPSRPPTKPLPKSILMKPSSSADPRLFVTSSRTVISESPADGETSQFLAKQDILWKGFLNMLTVAKFVSKGYLVSGSAENLKADLPDTIQIGGRILPQTVWDYVAKLKTSVTKELCVIRFHPATEEEEVAYVSLFSYFSSRGRFGVVANGSRSIKDVYLVPLSAKESIPSILQPLEGPGLEKNRPNLLLGLAVIQKAKRPGTLPQEIEEKRPKVHLSKDPMWIPKPPVLYGSDKLEIFQPYDPETPASTTPPGSPPCPGSPSDSSSSGSITIPSHLISIRTNPPVSTSAAVAATKPTSDRISNKNPKTASSNNTPLQTILKSLFGNKQTDSVVSSDGSSTTAVSDKKVPVFSQVSGSMVDPIVQQYGQKSKVKNIEQEEEENDFDRPYDPEEEYDPAIGYGVVAPQSVKQIKADGPAASGSVDDDVAYDPEDDTIFADIQSDVVTKPPVPTQTADSASCPIPVSTQTAMPAPTKTVTPAPTPTPAQTSTPAEATQNIPAGTVVVSAATLTEQQRLLEELNKQIEEQKRQLKEQEEALRQQREAVGMFMAHFSVSDSLMSPPQKSLPPSQLSESTDKTSNLTENVDNSNVDSQTVKLEDKAAIPRSENDTDSVAEQDETQDNLKESDKYSSAGEIADSDVAYDPEDESLFNEIQDDVFQGGSKSRDSSLSRTGHSASRKGTQNSHHSRKRRLSPKKRSHRERDRHRSPSRRSQQRSPSHSRRRRERDRHRRSERDRSRHRARDQSERQGRHRKEHSTRRHSHGHRRSPSAPTKKDSGSLSPKQHRGLSPQVLEKSKPLNVLCNAPDSSDSVVGQIVDSNTSFTSITIKNDPDGLQLKSNLVESVDKGCSPCSHELPHNMKLETSEPLTQEPEKTVVSHDNAGSASSTRVDKPSQQETLFTSKFENTIPLRELDPPIRDSPQSPDPEPQFVKPSSIEQIDSVKTEEIRDPETHTSVSMPLIKVENNFLPIGGQATVSTTLWPIAGGPISNLRNMDFRALNLQVPVVKDKCMTEADKQIEGGSPGLKHPVIQGQGGGHSKPAAGFQGSGPEINPVANCPEPGMSGLGIRDAGSDMKELGQKGPQVDLRETGIRFPGSDMRVPGMQGISPNIWGLGSHTQDLSSMQGMIANVKGPGPDMRHSESQIRGQVPVPTEPLSAMYHPVPENPDSRPDVMAIGRDQSFGVLQIEGKAQDIGRGRGDKDRGGSPHAGAVGSAMIGRGVRDQSPGLRRPGPSFRGSGIVQRQLRHDGSPILEERGLLKTGFQAHGRDADLSRMGGGKERSLDPNAATGSEGRLFRTDIPSPAMTDERWGLQRGQDVPMRGPGPNINYEGGGSNMSCIGQDGSGPKEQFSELQPNIRADRGVHGPEVRESELRRPDMAESGYIGPGQDISSTSGSDKRGIGMPNITKSDWRGPGLGVAGPDIRGQNKGLGPHVRGQNWSDPGLDIRDDWRGPDRGRSDQVRGQSFIQDEWGVHRPDRRGPNVESQGPGRRGAEYVDRPGSEMSGLNMKDVRHDRRGPGGPDFMGPEPDRTGPTIDNLGPGMRGPGVQDFLEPGLEGRGLAMDSLGPNRRGPGGPYFRGPGPERKGPAMEGHGPGISGPGPDFMRGPDVVGSGSDRRGLGDKDVWGTGPERRLPAMEGPMSGGPNFNEPGPESRGLSMEGPGLAGRGPVGPDFRGPGPERRGPAMEHCGPGGRGPGGPDFRGLKPERRGPTMEVPGPDRREHEGPDFREPGPERRGPAMEHCGPGGRGPGGPGFRGLKPERRGPTMEVPGPDRREHKGPDFREPGPERRGPAMEHCGPGGRGPGGPDFRGLKPERRGPTMEVPGPDSREHKGPDFREPGHERRGPLMDGPGPDRRGLEGPDFRGPGLERMHSSMEHPERGGLAMDAPGPDRRGPGGPDFRGPRPERRSSSMERPERRGPAMEGPGPDRRGPGGPDFRGPGPERRSLSMERPERRRPAMEGPVPERRGPGDLDFRGPGPERRGPAIEDPGPERRGPVMEGPGPDRRGSGGPDFRGPGPESQGLFMEGPWPDSRGPGGPDFRGPGPERRNVSMGGPERRGPAMEAPGSDRRGSGGPDFSGAGPDMDSQEPDRRGPRGLEFQRLGPESRGLAMDGRGHYRRGPGGPDLSGSGCERRGPFMEGQGPDRGGPENQNTGLGPDRIGPHMRGPAPYFTGPGPERNGPECLGPHNRGQEGPHFRGPGPESEHPNIEGPGPDRRVPDIWGPRPEIPGPNMESSGPNRRVPGGPDMRRPNLGPNREGPGPDRRGLEGPNFREPMSERIPPDVAGPEFDRRGPHLKGVRPERTDMEGPGPDRKRPRGPDFRGPGCESRDPDIEGPGPDRREPRGSGFREPGPGRIGPDMEGPEQDWRRSGGPDFRGPGFRQTCPNTEDSRHRRDGWGDAEFSGSEPIQMNPDPEGQGPDRIGRNLRGSRRMRGNRGPGPDRRSLNRGDRWKGPDFRGSGPGRRGTDTEEQWSDGRGPDIESVGNGRECSDGDWKRHGNRGPGPIQEDPGDQVQEHSRHGPHREWRGPQSRGPRAIQERSDMQFPGHLRGPGDFRGQGPVQDDPDMVCPGPIREGPGNEWRDSDGPFFSGENDPGNRRHSHDRRGPGSDMRRGPDMGNDRRQADFRDNMRGPNMEGPGAHREAPDLMNSYTNRRGFEIEGPDRRGPRGPDLRRSGSEHRNNEGPGFDRRGPGMIGSGLDSRGSEPALNDDMQGLDVRSPRCDSRGSDMTASSHFNSPHEVTRFQGPSDPHSAPHNRPPGPVRNRRENSCPRFDNKQNQQVVKPQRHRAGLLPTPTEGLIRFPNRIMNNPDVFNPKRKRIGHPTDREWSRDRQVSRERELVREQRQEQERSPAGKISNPVDASTKAGKGKKEVDTKTDKQGACVENKTLQSTEQ